MSLPDPARDIRREAPFDWLKRWVPGFAGYRDQEDRRQADYVVRTWMADRLEKSKTGLDSAMRKFTDEGALDVLPALERVRGQLDKVIQRLRAAVRGYSGLFAEVRVDNEDLERVYQHDRGMMENADRLARRLESAESDADSLLDDLSELNRQIDAREELLKGLAK